MKKISFLLSAGIPLIQAFDIVSEKENNGYKKQILENVIRRIRSGMSIHKSLNYNPAVLDPFSLHIIESSERNGKMKEGTIRISKMLESHMQKRGKLIAAILYPACVIFFALLLIIFLLFFVFPKILPLLNESNVSLPLSTRLLLAVNYGVRHFGIAILTLLMVAAITFRYIIKRNHSFKKYFYHTLFRALMGVTFINRCLRLVFLSSFSQTLSMYIQSGHTLVEALSYITEAEVNPFYKNIHYALQDRVRKGERFSTVAFSFPSVFSAECVQFLNLGEETGNLSEMLSHFAKSCDEELDEIQKRIFSLIEPLLMLVLGIVVGFIALSLIGPIYSLTSSINVPK